MGNIDSIAKKFASDNFRFADIFNYFIYDGKQIISPENLRPAEIEELVLPFANGEQGKIQKYRDILKLWAAKEDDKAVYVLLGIELQNKIHYAMPVRNMLYDAANYSKQVEQKTKEHRINRKIRKDLTADEFLSGFQKNDKIVPVITLVIFLSNDQWDGPTSIHEMFSAYDQRILELVPDYKLNLISPGIMTEKDFDKLISDFEFVMKFIKYSNDKDRLMEKIEKDKKYQAVDRTSVDLVNAVTGSNLQFKEQKGKVNVCKAIEELRMFEREEGREEGREEAREEGRIEEHLMVINDLVFGYRTGAVKLDFAAKLARMSEEEFLAKVDSEIQQNQEDD